MFKNFHLPSTLTVVFFAGDGGGEAGRERSKDGRAAAVRAEKTAQRHRDYSQRKRPPQRSRHQRDQRYGAEPVGDCCLVANDQ